MKRGRTIGIVLLLIAITGAFFVLFWRLPKSQPVALPTMPPIQSSTVYFDDADEAFIRLGNAGGEMVFDKRNGAILSIADKSSGAVLAHAPSSGNLWSASFLYSYQSIASSDFASDTAQAFSYTWDAEARQLLLQYTPAAAVGKYVVVTVVVAVDEGNAFHLQMKLDNHWGYEASEIRFPDGLVLDRNAIQEALLPVMPGIVLQRGFFERAGDYTMIYPGWPGVFADFTAATFSNGKAAFYSTSDVSPFTPVYYGLRFTDCEGADSVCYVHSIRPRARSEMEWTSPVFHIRLGEEWGDSIAAYRSDAGIDQAASLEEKLGSLFSAVAAAPLYKADADQLSIPFSDYPALLQRIPQPGILHLVAYSPGGFDRNYPDFLPPAERFGTTEDLTALAGEAHALGFLVMPYTNPTWWDGKSPTLSNLPEGTRLQEITALSDQGMQFEECYGCPTNPHYGYVVTPQSAFVQERLRQLIGDVQAAGFADLLFEDQIGARAAIYDYGPSAPSGDSYLQGWLEHTRAYTDARLATEGGFDQLVASEVGLHMSVLLPDRRGETAAWWGDGNWHYYPFVAQAAGDKVLFYQHNLAPESFTHGKATLLWNVAMGYMLSHDLVKSQYGGGIEGEMLPVVGAFQRYVLSTYVGQRVTAYTNVSESITQTQFGDVRVYANWDARKTFHLGDFSVPGNGFLIQKQDGSLTAGVFTNYNQAELSQGEHYLIEERRSGVVIVRQPRGGDTPLRVKAESDWGDTASLQAYAKDDTLLAQAPVSLADGYVVFDYVNQIDGEAVSYYRIGASE